MTIAHAPGEREASEDGEATARLSALFDHGETRAVAGAHAEPAGSGVRTATGMVDGVEAFAFATEPRRMGGALGAAGCAQIVETIAVAVRASAPVIGLWHSGGARLPDGVRALDGVGRVFAAIVRASGRVPQISVVLGPAAGGAAYGPSLTDIVVMSDRGRIFVTGPDVVRKVTGEDVDALALGGPDVHSRRSGVAHVVTADDAAALAAARRLTGLLGRPDLCRTAEVTASPDLGGLIPARARQAYDARPLVHALLDEPGMELQPRWAPNMITALGRLAGGTVGVLANNPLRKGGCLDSLSAEKAARFVRMCDAQGVPLVVVVDVPGYLPGAREEWNGVVRRGAKLLRAFAEATVPRVTLVTRKAYGGAFIAMNSRALGADAVFAWPGAKVAVMDETAAVGILHRRELAACPADRLDALTATLIRGQQDAAGGLDRAVQEGVVDAVIPPALTRRRLAEALRAALPGERHSTERAR